MDRYRVVWTKQGEGFGSTRWVEVSAAQPGTPTPHRQESEVEASSPNLLHRLEEARVAGEVHPLAAFDHVADRRCGRSAGHAAAGMQCRDDVDDDRANRESVAHVHLGNLPHAGSANHCAEPARYDDVHVGVEETQRRQIEVIVMRVRHQDRVDGVPGRRFRLRGRPIRPPIRGRSAGSVRIVAPSSARRSVACPNHVTARLAPRAISPFL